MFDCSSMDFAKNITPIDWTLLPFTPYTPRTKACETPLQCSAGAIKNWGKASSSERPSGSNQAGTVGGLRLMPTSTPFEVPLFELDNRGNLSTHNSPIGGEKRSDGRVAGDITNHSHAGADPSCWQLLGNFKANLKFAPILVKWELLKNGDLTKCLMIPNTMIMKMTPSSTPFPEEKTRIADSLFVVSREAPDISDLSRTFCIPKVGILTEFALELCRNCIIQSAVRPYSWPVVRPAVGLSSKRLKLSKAKLRADPSRIRWLAESEYITKYFRVHYLFT